MKNLLSKIIQDQLNLKKMVLLSQPIESESGEAKKVLTIGGTSWPQGGDSYAAYWEEDTGKNEAFGLKFFEEINDIPDELWNEMILDKNPRFV